MPDINLKAKFIIKIYQEFCNKLFQSLIDNGPIEDDLGNISWPDNFRELVSCCRRASYDVDSKLMGLYKK